MFDDSDYLGWLIKSRMASLQGLEDLRHGIIRTPLPPRQTFLDDPLRVIRCIRFASRFGYDLVLELAEAAKDPEIQVRVVYKSISNVETMCSRMH